MGNACMYNQRLLKHLRLGIEMLVPMEGVMAVKGRGGNREEKQRQGLSKASKIGIGVILSPNL